MPVFLFLELHDGRLITCNVVGASIAQFGVTQGRNNWDLQAGDIGDLIVLMQVNEEKKRRLIIVDKELYNSLKGFSMTVIVSIGNQ